MFVIPFRISDAEYSLFIGLQDDNLERMKKYDPAEVTISKLGFRGRLKDVIIGYATEEDFREASRALNNGEDGREVLKNLARGFRYRPEAGDHDGPYLSAKAGEGPVS